MVFSNDVYTKTLSNEAFPKTNAKIPFVTETPETAQQQSAKSHNFPETMETVSNNGHFSLNCLIMLQTLLTSIFCNYAF